MAERRIVQFECEEYKVQLVDEVGAIDDLIAQLQVRREILERREKKPGEKPEP